VHWRNCALRQWVDEIDGRGQFHQTFFTKQKVVSAAHSVWQKICCSISPKIDSPDCRLKSIEKILQICVLLAKSVHHLPSTVCQKKSFSS